MLYAYQVQKYINNSKFKWSIGLRWTENKSQKLLKSVKFSILSLSMESQPQNSEFRNNPENFYPCVWSTVFNFIAVLKSTMLFLVIGKVVFGILIKLFI